MKENFVILTAQEYFDGISESEYNVRIKFKTRELAWQFIKLIDLEGYRPVEICNVRFI